MLEKEQYWSIIGYLFLKGKPRQEIVKELNEVFGADCPSLAIIKRWFNDFQRGRTSVFDEEKPGRPKEINENLTKMVKEERRINTRELPTRLCISKGTVHTFFVVIGY